MDGTAIGFMSISDDVNFSLLNDCFELGPFHGLRKPHADDITSPEPTPVASPTPPKGEVLHKFLTIGSMSVEKRQTSCHSAHAWLAADGQV